MKFNCIPANLSTAVMMTSFTLLILRAIFYTKYQQKAHDSTHCRNNDCFYHFRPFTKDIPTGRNNLVWSQKKFYGTIQFNWTSTGPRKRNYYWCIHIYLFLNTVNFAFKPLKRAPDKPPEMKKNQIELISFFKLCIELNLILRGTHAYVPITAINRNIGISIVWYVICYKGRTKYKTCTLKIKACSLQW